MLSTLKKIQSKSSPGGHFRVFFGFSCVIFPYFLRIVWFVMKTCSYILDNTLMVVRLKIFMEGIALWFALILSWFFLEGEGPFSVFFSISWEMFGMFHEILQRYSWYYSGNHKKQYGILTLFCKAILNIIQFTFWDIIQLSLPWEIPDIPSPDVLHRCSGH